MTTDGPLRGLRVIDLTDDTGRFATKLLAELGASVVRVAGSRPSTSGPTMVEPAVAERGGLLDWWFDGGKQRLDICLHEPGGVDAYRRLATRANLVMDTEPPGRLAQLGVDHADLATENPALVQVSLTAFGRTGPRAGWATSDLVAGALAGSLSVCGLPDEPIAPWGAQACNVAGFHAALCGLAGVLAAQRTGVGQHVDLSLHEAVTTSVEQLFFQSWFDDLQPYPKVPPRQGSLHWSHAYEVVPARTGAVMLTLTPAFPAFFEWLAEEHFPEAAEFAGMTLEELVPVIPRVMEVAKAFVATRDAADLWGDAQKRRLAWAEVQGPSTVAANPQHHHRGFFRTVAWDGPDVAMPGPLARFSATPPAAPQPPAKAAVDVDDVLHAWGDATPEMPASSTDAPAPGAAAGKPLDGVRVLDLTHVLAGPHATRIFGDLGADVIKLQTTERATSVNDPAHPYFYIWNRSKRGMALQMRDRRAIDVIRRLIEHSDVLIENFSAGVLDRWGLSYEQVRAWNPRIVYVSMSGCGHDGPWSQLLTYAPTIHALAGLTYLSNPPERHDVGVGFSLNDHAAGLSAVVAVLAALWARERTGEGQHVDIAQMETGTYLVGPALIELLANGHAVEPAGNVDAWGRFVPNECYRTADGGFLAVTCRDDDEWATLVDVIDADAAPGLATVSARRERIADVDALVAAWAATVTADEGQERLQAAGVPAGRIQDAVELLDDPQHVARGLWRQIDHAVFGARPQDRFPAIWSGTDLEPYRPSPSYVGEHSFEVLTELGFDDAGVAEGMADGLFS